LIAALKIIIYKRLLVTKMKQRKTDLLKNGGKLAMQAAYNSCIEEGSISYSSVHTDR
jgi:hypothetical protein